MKGPKTLAKMTKAELTDYMMELTNDPANREEDISKGCIFKPPVSKLMRKIAEWITHRMIEEQKAAGTYVEPGGYSGRQSKKRR